MPKINDFVTELTQRSGLAVANRYRVTVSLPQALGLDSAVSRSLDLLCDSANLPGRTVNTVDYQAHKQVIKVPISFSNEDVSFTFLLTGDFFVRKVFDQWLGQVISFDKYRANYLLDHVADVSIYQTAKGESSSAQRPSVNTQEPVATNDNLNPVALEPAVMMPAFTVSETRIRDDVDVYGVRLLNAYPIAVSAITLDNTAENTVQKVTVTMTYENFEVLPRFRSI